MVKLKPFAAVVVAALPKWKFAVVVVFPESKVSPVSVVEAREEETVPVNCPTFKSCAVEEAARKREVPVAFTKANCGKVLTEVVVAVKNCARMSPWTSSLAREVVAVAPIKT